MDIVFSTKAATKIFLGINLMLLSGFAFTLMFILLENKPDLYAWAYYATYDIQPYIICLWFLALVLSPALAIVFSFYFGCEIRKTIQWKIGVTIMVFAGLPSLLFVAIGYVMRGI